MKHVLIVLALTTVFEALILWWVSSTELRPGVVLSYDRSAFFIITKQKLTMPVLTDMLSKAHEDDLLATSLDPIFRQLGTLPGGLGGNSAAEASPVVELTAKGLEDFASEYRFTAPEGVRVSDVELKIMPHTFQWSSRRTPTSQLVHSCGGHHVSVRYKLHLGQDIKPGTYTMGLKLPAFDSIEKSHHIMVGSTVDLTGEKDPKERDYKIWKATPWSELKPGSLASDGIKFPDLTVIAPGHLPGFSRLWQTLLIAFLLAAGTYAKLIEE